jgi:site-specific recombinase XerD
MTKDYLCPIFTHALSKDFTQLSEVLSKSPGYNQSDKPSMLCARNDADAIQTFLLDYKDTELTYRSYLKEIERLVMWCIHIPKITISDLKREHLIAYRDFIIKPQPVDLWCGPKQSRLIASGAPNPQWRPFVSGLSKPTVRKTISILDSFFNYLVNNNYLAGNPLAVDRRRKGTKSNSTERWLERDEIATTLEALDALQCESPQRTFVVARAKYLILTLFYTGLRLAELAKHTMGHFQLIENEWYLTVVGKGEKPRKIVVVDEYLDIMVKFRQQLGLPSRLPEYGELTPLIPALNKIAPITDNRISQIIKWAFFQGALRYECLPINEEEEQMKFQHKASKLRNASAHWLRHSYGTYLVKSGCSIEKVRELMGHSDISTTMIYVHIAKNDLHLSARNLSLTENVIYDSESKLIK